MTPVRSASTLIGPDRLSESPAYPERRDRRRATHWTSRIGPIFGIIFMALVAATSVAAEPADNGTTFTLTVDPENGPGFYDAAFRIWLPSDAPVRAIVVLQHGCGERARIYALDHVLDPQWQAFATEAGVALLAPSYGSLGGFCRSWSDPSLGSGSAFEFALTRLGQLARRPDLETLPLLLWGHSGGGAWSMAYALSRPDRVRGVVLRSGACLPAHGEVTDPGACDIVLPPLDRLRPTLFIKGANEGRGDALEAFITRFDAIAAQGQEVGAAWRVLVDPTAGHEVASTRDPSIQYFGWLLGMVDDARLDRSLSAFGRSGAIIDDTLPPAPETYLRHQLRRRARALACRC